MKLISFTTSAGNSFGVVNGDGVDAGKHLGLKSLREALTADALPRIAELKSFAPDYQLAKVSLPPVIPDPTKFYVWV